MLKKERKRERNIFARNKKNKKAQITIFIIIAVLIVAGILILLYPRIKIAVSPLKAQIYLEGCVKEKLEESVKAIEERGGSINPSLAINYQGKKIEYLCFTNEYYKTCNQQQPLLKQHIEREILEDIRADVSVCLSQMKADMARQGYSVESSGAEKVEVEIVPNRIKVLVKPDVVFSKEDTKERHESFEISYRSNLYDISILALNILNWEAVYGDSDIYSFMIFYPNLKVEKYKQDE